MRISKQIVVLGSVVLFLMLAVGNVSAQVGAKPEDKIGAAVGRLQEKNDAYLKTMKEHFCPTGSCDGTPVQKHFDRLSSLQEQGKRLHAKNSADDYKALTQKRTGKQTIKKGTNTDDEIVSTPDYDDERADEIVAQLDEIGSMTEIASTAMVQRARVSLTAGTTASLPSAPYSYLGPYRSDTSVALGLWAAKHAAETAVDTASFLCNQDTFGFNASAACSIFAVIADFTAGLCDFDSFVSGDVDSAEIQGSYMRLEAVWNRVGNVSDQVSTGQAELLNQLQAIEAALNARMSAIEAKQNQIIQLLNTPQGQRPQFPVK